MTTADVLLVALGAIAVGAGMLVVGTRHLVRAGLWLVVALGAVAGLYLVLTAELVAWVQVLLYVGAVVVLLLFAVMLTRAPIGARDDLDRPGWPALLVGAGAGVGLAALLGHAYRWSTVELPAPGNPQRLGAQIFGAWVLPFEVLSVLLLAALVGAIVISRLDIGSRPQGGFGPGGGPDGIGGPDRRARVDTGAGLGVGAGSGTGNGSGVAAGSVATAGSGAGAGSVADAHANANVPQGAPARDEVAQ